MKFSKRLMACGLAVVMASTCIGASDVALAAKKPRLSQKKVTITVGKKKTIKVKNASKTVKWSSNKKKVVTVKGSGKKKAIGTLKGVSKGTATVTAKVGKKKLTCKVTVKKASSSSMQNAATNIQSIAVDQLDTQCIVLTLNKATPLSVTDLSIAVKDYKEGSYNYYPTIKTIASADQQTYRIYLNDSIPDGFWVKAIINKTKDSLQYQYKREITGYTMDEIREKDKTTKISASKYFSYSTTIGLVSCDITSGNLPTGLSLNRNRGIIKGIPTIAGEYPVTIMATDELGRTATASITFKVYDDDYIAVSNTTRTLRIDDYIEEMAKDQEHKDDVVKDIDNLYSSYNIDIVPHGGSGKYKFELLSVEGNNGKNIRLSTNSYDSQANLQQRIATETTLHVPYNIDATTYTCKIKVSDAQKTTNTSKELTVTLIGQKYCNISSLVTASNGQKLSGNEMFFYPKDATSSDDYIKKVTFTKKQDGSIDLIPNDYTTVVSSDRNASGMGLEEGTCKAEVPVGDYIVKIKSDAEDVLYQSNTVTVTKDDDTCNLTVPVKFYSVTATAKYQNGSTIKNQKVFFEIREEQYESIESTFGEKAHNMKFSVTTDMNGQFITSLPTNTYSAYVLDEDGYRRYFTKDLSISGDSNVVTIGEINVGIDRYSITGTASVASGPLKNTNLRFYNNNTGEYRTSTTDENGNFAIGLPGNITYVVKAEIAGPDNKKVWHKLDTIPVSNADVTKTLTYSITNEFQNDETIVKLNEPKFFNGAQYGSVRAKYECKDSGTYTFTGAVKDAKRDQMSLYVFDKDGNVIASDTDVNYNEGVQSVSGTGNMQAGETYYIMLVPETEKIKTNPETNENMTSYPVAVSGTYSLTVQ